MQIIKSLFEKLGLRTTNSIVEVEGKEYQAARFEIDGQRVLFRKAKQTPKKIGQFVTCWKRNEEGITAPFQEQDKIDFYFIFVENEKQEALFVFPKSELIQRGIIASNNKVGKRGFRIYPIWDIPKSQQAIKTQEWQIKFFVDLLDIERFNELIK